MSCVSTGTEYSAGSVPSSESCRDGRQVPSAVVGGLADPGPCPAQPGRGGHGEYSRQPTPNDNKRRHTTACDAEQKET